MKKIKILALICASFIILGFSQAALAIDDTGLNKMQEQNEAFNSQAHFNSTASITSIVSGVLTAIFGLLSVVFLVLIIIAGFQWMTAGGNEDTIKKAQKIMKNAIIGLAIVLGSYLITHAIFTFLPLGVSSNLSSNTSEGGGS